MSETKHTPLPWRVDKNEVQHSCCWGTAIVSPSGQDRPGRDSALVAEADQLDAVLIITSVNARPKVEMAVETGKQVKWDDIFSLLDKSSKQEWTDRLYQLRSNLREVSAALRKTE